MADLVPVEGDPFSVNLVPVDHDPFTVATQPVDYDPFGEADATKRIIGAAGNAIGGVANQLWNLPREALQSSEQLRTTGEYDPAPVVNAASLAMTGGMPLAEEGAAGIFGGRLAAENLAAQGVDQPSLALRMADHMDAQGATPEDIYQVTSKMLEGTPYAGVSKGAEGKWRFEIPDNTLTVSGGSRNLGAAIAHPGYFTAYPNATKYEANIVSSTDPHGSYLDGVLNAAGPENELPSIVAHEIQHPIQEAEGFAQGGNEKSYFLYSAPEVQPMIAQRDRLSAAWDAEAGKPIPNPERLKRIETDLYQLDPMIERRAGLSGYHNLAGEVEARNVQTRLNMTPEERRASPPWTTEDVPRDQQIVRGSPTGTQQMAMGRGVQRVPPEDQIATERLIMPYSNDPAVNEIGAHVQAANNYAASQFREDRQIGEWHQAQARALAIKSGLISDPMSWAWPRAREGSVTAQPVPYDPFN